MYGCGICFVSIFLCSSDLQLPLCLCVAVSKGGEEGTSGFDLRAQNVLQVTPFYIRLAPEVLESVFLRRSWYNDTLLNVYPRLSLCSCAFEKGIVPWEGWRSFALQYEFKAQVDHNVMELPFSLSLLDWNAHCFIISLVYMSVKQNEKLWRTPVMDLSITETGGYLAWL